MNGTFIMVHFSFDVLYSLEELLIFFKYSKFLKLFSVLETSYFFFSSAACLDMKITFNLKVREKNLSFILTVNHFFFLLLLLF